VGRSNVSLPFLFPLFLYDTQQNLISCREPNVLKPFQELWGTDELLASFDTFNVTLPHRVDDDFSPWPHTDQAPERKGLACVQGLLNLTPAGPEDGGLLLMVGSSALFEEYFSTFEKRDRQSVDAKHYDFYGFKPEDIKWFESKGCHQIKVNAEPGDLVLWDSRTIHHVAKIESDTIRSVLYTCFTPAALASPEDIAYKAELFRRFEATTHWPHCNIWGQGKAKVNGETDPFERDEPLEKPVVTEQILKLAGVKPY
jgi:ectoine hydroxylase-related dioxygenase (phytanoyl-CoA dioxygenase family)